MKKKIFNISKLIFSILVLVVMLVLNYIYEDDYIGNVKFEYAIILPFTLLAYLLMSYNYFIEAFKHIMHGQIFDEVFLTLIATIAAFAIGEYVEALAVILFFTIGEYIEDIGYKKSKNSVKAIFDMRPDSVTLYNDGIEKVVDPLDVKSNDLFIVKPGERVPLDGVVISGKSELDTSSMTGESLPRSVKENEEIISGVVNLTSPLVIKATKEFYNSTLSQVLDLVENATNKKTKEEKFISRFAKIYTPIVVALAFIVAIIPPFLMGINDIEVWRQYIFTGATFLVVSCPCSLVISVPMAFFIGIGEASKYKALIKGSVYLEKLNKLDTLVLDKTGTITKGNFEVSKISEVNKEYNILELALASELHSNHPIAKAIKNRVKDIKIDKEDIKDYEVVEGKGIKLTYKNKPLYVGNAYLMTSNNLDYQIETEVGTILYINYDNKFIGSIVIKDIIKEDSIEAIQEFHNYGIKNTYMLTGDNEKVAKDVASKCGIDHVYASLLPNQKGEKLQEILDNKPKKSVVGFVGDGVNDALSLKMADLGISMGALGSDAAIEASDVVLMNDNLKTIPTIKRIAKSTLIVVYENLIFSIVVKVLVMIISLTGVLDSYAMWLAIFGDVGVTLICVINALLLSARKYNKTKKIKKNIKTKLVTEID